MEPDVHHRIDVPYPRKVGAWSIGALRRGGTGPSGVRVNDVTGQRPVVDDGAGVRFPYPTIGGDE
ncbi:hypothetical protein ABTX85_21815 [Streptomyces sp. NPDC096097]|uniref:hypothetical protein n=1 Tax=Streptomyces sp. NPDC096097 TaxID=3155546 RepID=UPI003319EACE